LCQTEEEIVSIGVSIPLKARMLLAKIEVYRREGVMLTELKAPAGQEQRGQASKVLDLSLDPSLMVSLSCCGPISPCHSEGEDHIVRVEGRGGEDCN
jgi:hypothetical protein